MQDPLEPFVPPTAPPTPADLRGYAAALERFPRAVRAAVAPLRDAELDTPFREGGWTVRQIVHHLADSHAHALLRVKWALTEERPVIKPYDQDRWAELADARTGPVGPALALLDGVHARLSSLLASLGPADFARAFVHPETGPSTVAGLAALYAWHGSHHLAQIAALAHRRGFAAGCRAHEHAERFRAAPERLFDLLVRPSAIRAWWGAARAVVVPELGGTWAAAWGGSEDEPDYATSAAIAVFERPRRLVLTDYRYRARSGPLPFRADFTTTFEVEADPEGALLRVRQDGFPAGREADSLLRACEEGWLNTFAGIRTFLAAG